MKKNEEMQKQSFHISRSDPIDTCSPSNGAANVALDVSLDWREGELTTLHKIYFGTTSSLTDSHYRGANVNKGFSPGALRPGTTYYWRIDEKNAYGTTRGQVWSFTTSSN